MKNLDRISKLLNSRAKIVCRTLEERNLVLDELRGLGFYVQSDLGGANYAEYLNIGMIGSDDKIVGWIWVDYGTDYIMFDDFIDLLQEAENVQHEEAMESALQSILGIN